MHLRHLGGFSSLAVGTRRDRRGHARTASKRSLSTHAAERSGRSIRVCPETFAILPLGCVTRMGGVANTGTEAAANLSSFVESARLAGVESSAYLEYTVCCALRGEAVPKSNRP